MVDSSRLEIVVLHAPLDPQDRAIVPETQVRRRWLLEMKQEQVVLSAREIMQFVANPVEKVDRVTQLVKLLLAQEARVPQILEPAHRVTDPANPEGRMHVPKTPRPLLDVRLLHVHRVAVLRVARSPLLELGLDIGRSPLPLVAPAKDGLHLIEEALVPG